MTHARHLTATGTPADLRAGRVRDAIRFALDFIEDVYGVRPTAIMGRVRRECLEVLEDAERERETLERELRKATKGGRP